MSLPGIRSRLARAKCIGILWKVRGKSAEGRRMVFTAATPRSCGARKKRIIMALHGRGRLEISKNLITFWAFRCKELSSSWPFPRASLGLDRRGNPADSTFGSETKSQAQPGLATIPPLGFQDVRGWSCNPNTTSYKGCWACNLNPPIHPFAPRGGPAAPWLGGGGARPPPTPPSIDPRAVLLRKTGAHGQLACYI